MGRLDYALIGNCQISAILDKEARIVWGCFPRLDSPALFASLVGQQENGVWSILPTSEGYESRQRYLRNTNVVQTEFLLANGDQFEIVDFAPRFEWRDGYYRAPQIFRIIRPMRGNPRVRMVFSPKFYYGSVKPEVSLSSDGCVYRHGMDKVYLHTDVPQAYVLDGEPFELSGNRYCVMSYGEPFDRPLKFSSEEFLDRTIGYWRTWIKHCSIPFEYQDAVIRSALALKLHIYEDTGAIIAATTTSIPESPHGNRTWDYRYCWLRDAYFVINVLNQLGHFEEMERFIQYLHHIAVTEGADKATELQPVYGVGGERELIERELPWLKGWEGIGPVRIGNAAYTHAQYDAYGEMVLAVTPLFFDSRLDRVDQQRAFDNVVQLVQQAIKCFELPDSSLWEYRSNNKHFLFSKLMCWAAVDRGIAIATRLGQTERFPSWFSARDRMRETIQSKAWYEAGGYYAEAYGGTEPDASTLLMGSLNFHPAGDPRWRKTVEAYEKLLMKNGYVYRYRSQDDFGVPLHAFTICTFWMVDALSSLGRTEEARAIFERVLACRNHVGLLSEDVEPMSGELWGNFPQTYSHVGVINSAFRLSRGWHEAF
jgi:GH15 family glucan-1,4-alpha-glucosidase